MDEAASRLGDRSAIEDLVSRWADAVNQRDVNAIVPLLTSDVEWTVPGLEPAQGVEAVVDLLGRLLANAPVVVQLVHQGLVDFDGSHATGRWYCSENGLSHSGTPFAVTAVYHDRYVRNGNDWRFAARRFDLLTRSLPQDRAKGYAFPDVGS